MSSIFKKIWKWALKEQKGLIWVVSKWTGSDFLKREECPSVSEFSTKDRGRVRVEKMMNGCSEPSSLKREGFTTHYLIQSQLRQLLLLSTDSTFPTWHSTWTRSIQPSALPLSGLYCTCDPLLLSSPLFFLSPFYRKPNKDTKTEKNPQFTNHIAWQHNTISFNPPVVYRVWIICESHDQYYHHACVLIWSVVRFYNCDSIMYLLYNTPWEKIEWYLILFSLISEWLHNVKSTVINLLPHSIEKCAFDYEHTCHFMLRRTFTVIPFLCQHGANELSTGHKKIGSMVDKKESWYCM